MCSRLKMKSKRCAVSYRQVNKVQICRGLAHKHPLTIDLHCRSSFTRTRNASQFSETSDDLAGFVSRRAHTTSEMLCPFLALGGFLCWYGCTVAELALPSFFGKFWSRGCNISLFGEVAWCSGFCDIHSRVPAKYYASNTWKSTVFATCTCDSTLSFSISIQESWP